MSDCGCCRCVVALDRLRSNQRHRSEMKKGSADREKSHLESSSSFVDLKRLFLKVGDRCVKSVKLKAMKIEM
jgi:hypothetical protein